MKNLFKYFSILFILLFVLSGCSFFNNIQEDPVEPNYETGLTQQELFAYLNRFIGYREEKVDDYIYFSFYSDNQVTYSFSSDEINYKGNVIEFKYNGKDHFEVSCQFDPDETQSFASFVKTFDILFEEQHPDKLEISFDGNTYKLIDDKGYDYGVLILSLQLFKYYFIEFDDVSLYVGFFDNNQFSYDNGSKVITGLVDNVTYLGKDVYDLNIKITDNDKHYHNSFLLTYSSVYPDKIFIELDDYGKVEMLADKGYDTIEILTLLTNDGPFEEVNGKNIRLFDVDNFYYIKTNSNADFLLKGQIILFDYQGKGNYKMTVQFSSDASTDGLENTYDIEVSFNYNVKDKILKIKEYDISRMIEENYIFKVKK